MRRSRAVVTALGCLAVALAITSVAASVISDWTWAEYVASYTFTNTVVGLALAGPGAVLAWFRPRNAVGWLLLAGGLGHLVSAALAPVGVIGLAAEWPIVLTRALATVFVVAWGLGLPTLFFLALLLFPDGRVPSRKWSWLAGLIVASAVWSVVTPAITPVATVPGEPGSVSLLAIPSAPVALFDVVNTVVSLTIVAAVLMSLVLRYVRGTEATRRQLLWLILAVFAMFVLNLQRWITGDGPILLLLSAGLLPIAIAIAILREGLLDIRVVVSRTLVYGLLIGLVVALYAGLVAALTAVVPAEADRTVAVVAAVVVALVFNPLRVLLQRAISRAFFGNRDDPAIAARRVSSGLDDRIDDVLEGLRASLRLPRLAVTSRDGAVIAEAGAVPDGAVEESLPLDRRADMDAANRLVVTLRAGEQRLHPADARVIELVRGPIALLLHARALTEDLRRARVQTVEARELERARLYRELHDGLGPALTGSVMRMDAAANVIAADPARARAVLEAARRDTAAALEELRGLVYGLRPLALNGRGLVAALREQEAADTVPSVSVVADDDLPDVSPAIEVAAYRVATEGIANARRHSDARHVRVELAARDGALEVTVVDDGTPPQMHTPGVGIRSILERAEELGGTASVGPSPGGWSVSATFPFSGVGSR